MDPWQFFYDNFIRPMDERTGYNAINTITYAAIALLAAYLLYKGLQRLKIKIDDSFVPSIIPFILFGSTLRVVVDANILPYSYLTTTPGIYPTPPVQAELMYQPEVFGRTAGAVYRIQK